MRKLLLLSVVAIVASSATGCNCVRNRCGGRQASYAAAAPVMCCPQQQMQCFDPCATGGTMMEGSPMVSDGASCCN